MSLLYFLFHYFTLLFLAVRRNVHTYIHTHNTAESVHTLETRAHTTLKTKLAPREEMCSVKVNGEVMLKVVDRHSLVNIRHSLLVHISMYFTVVSRNQKFIPLVACLKARMGKISST
jgi:hypothetical protein